jgi:hypothetical protein
VTITTMTQMWSLLRAYTLTPAGIERPVNHLNEWGGFSRRVELPVFTGWFDLTQYDREKRTTTALVLDTQWSNRVGVNNQEYWLSHAEQNNDGVAAFFVIHAVDEDAEPRVVKTIDGDAIFVGKIVRDGNRTFIVGHRRPL